MIEEFLYYNLALILTNKLLLFQENISYKVETRKSCTSITIFSYFAQT